ncbi:MAG TPA: hypothetical protein DCP07_05580 [Lachnospiraceae bacterium]|nr:hypothetical protein [Lachnospiraceae bacterium]
MDEALRTESVDKTRLERKIIDTTICLMFLVIAAIMIIAGISCFMDGAIMSGVIYLVIGAVMSLLTYMYGIGDFDFLD